MTKATLPWFQGREATRPPEFNNFNLSIQRQIGNSMVVEIGYNGVMGSHLQSQLLQYNQVNPTYLTAFGTIEQSTAVLNSRLGSHAGDRGRHRRTVPGIHRVLERGSATVRQALRPYPQYNGIDTYRAAAITAAIRPIMPPFSVSKSALGRAYLPDLVRVFEDVDRFRLLLGHRLGGRPVQSRARKIDRPVRRDAQFQVRCRLRPAIRSRETVPESWPRSLDARQLANQQREPLLKRHAGRHHEFVSLPLCNGRSTPYTTCYDGWAGATQGGSFDPPAPVAPFLRAVQSGPFPAQGLNALNRFGNTTRYNPKLRTFPSLTENMSVTRVFPIHESIRLEFRAEAFNVFNRVRFGTGPTQLQDPELRTPHQLKRSAEYAAPVAVRPKAVFLTPS